MTRQSHSAVLSLVAAIAVFALLMTGGEPAFADLNQGLVGHWTFDEGSGTIAQDSTANHNDATIYGGAQWGEGMVGGALCFDGVNDYAVADHINPDYLTVACWVKWSHFDTTGGGVAWLSNADSTPREGYLMYGCSEATPNSFSYFVTTPSGCHGGAVDVVTLDVDTWYHFVVTYDGDILRVYVDGDPVVEDDQPSGPVVATSNPLIFGKAYEPNNPWSINFHGYLDDARIYDRALSTAEVGELYAGGSGNQPPVADAGGPYVGTVGDAITFDASGSSDDDGTIVAYRWDWTNDGTWDTSWLGDAVTSHTYDAGFYGHAGLQVQDDDGATDTDLAGVDVPAPSGAYTLESCSNAFEDISGSGTLLSLGDDGGETVPIGFLFGFYGLYRSQVGVSANGYLTFSSDLTNFVNDVIPSPIDPDYLIAPLWDDLNPTAGGTIQYQMLGTAPNRRFVVQWTNVPQFVHTDSNTFQAILFEDTHCINFRYGEFTPEDPPGDYTVGIENEDGSSGVAAPHDMLSPGACLSFRFGPPQNQPPVADAGGAYSGVVDQPITLDGSSSSDPEDGDLEYRWDFFGTGTTWTDWAASPTVGVTFPTPGTHEIQLEVRDDGGLTDLDATQVNVGGRAPQIICPMSGERVSSYIEGYDISGKVRNPDGQVSDVQIRVDDGPWLSYTNGLQMNGTLFWVFQQWDTAGLTGAHTIYARSLDGGGLPSDEVSVTVDVVAVSSPPAIEIHYPADDSTVGGAVTITGSAIDPSGTVESVWVAIDDGNWTGGWTLASGTDPWTHQWNTETTADGPHAILARSYDGLLRSELVLLIVNVYNDHQPPVPNIVSVYPDPAGIGEEVTLEGAGSDPDGHDIVAYEWTSPSAGLLCSGPDPVCTVTFTEPGYHLISLHVKDQYGKWSDVPATTMLQVIDGYFVRPGDYEYCFDNEDDAAAACDAEALALCNGSVNVWAKSTADQTFCNGMAEIAVDFTSSSPYALVTAELLSIGGKTFHADSELHLFSQESYPWYYCTTVDAYLGWDTILDTVVGFFGTFFDVPTGATFSSIIHTIAVSYIAPAVLHAAFKLDVHAGHHSVSGILPLAGKDGGTENRITVQLWGFAKTAMFTGTGEVTRYGIISYIRIEPTDEPLAQEDMWVEVNCPVKVEIVDPGGRTLTLDYSEIPGTRYLKTDRDSDGEPDNYIFIPSVLDGDYLIQVIPIDGADPGDTYSVYAMHKGEASVLAEDVPIADIPAEPYQLGIVSVNPPFVALDYPGNRMLLSGTIVVKWQATDYEDGDDLPITFAYSDDNGASWVAVGADLPNTGWYVWDTTDVPDGSYQLRIAATDSDQNLRAAESGYLVVCNSIAAPENDAPGTPTRPAGQTTGYVGIQYPFEAHAEDPEGDQIYYRFDWADGLQSGWLGPYESGDVCSESWTWSEAGTYEVSVIAKDEQGRYSETSAVLPVCIGTTDANSNGLPDECELENDDCDSDSNLCCATSLDGVTIAASSYGAPQCDGQTPENEVWYSFVGTGRVMTTDTIGSTIDTVMAVYVGTCEDLACIASDDDSGGDLTSSIELCTLPLEKYYVAVWQKGGGGGEFVVNLTCGSPCDPPTGRCCYDAGASCLDDITEEQCVTAHGGDWDEGLDCTTPCPTDPGQNGFLIPDISPAQPLSEQRTVKKGPGLGG